MGNIKQYFILGIPFVVLIVALLWIERVASDETTVEQSPLVQALDAFYENKGTWQAPENLDYKEDSKEEYFLRGMDCLNEKNYEQAQEFFTKSLINPKADPALSIYTYFFINSCTEKMTGTGDASAITNALVFLTGYPPMANKTVFLWEMVSTLISTPEGKKEAISLMENYLEATPSLGTYTKVWILNTIAMLEYTGEDYVRSIRRLYDVEILLANQPLTPEMEYELLFAQEYIANIHLLLENYESAVEMYEELIDRKQEEFYNYISYLQLAESYLKLGKHQKARAIILELQGLLPKINENEVREVEASIHDILANVFMMEGNLHQAQLHLKQAADFYEENDDNFIIGGEQAATITHCNYLLHTGEFQKAQEILENLLNSKGSYEPTFEKEALVLLEKIYKETNQQEKLIQVYQDMLAINKEFTQILQRAYLEFSEYYRENSYLRQDNSRLKQINLMAVLVIVVVTCSLTIILILFRLLSTKNLTDQLTGVNNRKKLNQLAGLYRRKGTPEFFGVLMIDIDFFKLYNDSYGHMAGDQVLKQVAKMLLDSVRSNDIVIRYGGEEFLVLLTKVTDPIAQSICSRILQKLEKLQIPHKASKISDHITVSIGMCYQEEKNTFSLDKLIQQADRALYQSKEGGRNRTTVWKEED